MRKSETFGRVLLVNYSGEWTGPTKSLCLLLRHLKDDFELEVLFPGGGSLEEILRREGVGYHTSALTKWTIPAVSALIRRRDIDAVYANNTHGSSRNAFLAAWVARRSFVCHVRGMAWDKSWLRLGYLRFADAVVAVSRQCGESVSRFVRPNRLHVVYNGVPMNGTSRDYKERGSLRRELGLTQNSVVILSLSHLCERKGQLHAVEALTHVKAGTGRIHLCLAGRTDRETKYTSRVRKRARELGVEERVHLLGFRRAVDELLADADILVHSAVEDPHPRAVIEAMAASVPVVAFAVDGVAETVLDGSTGRLVDVGDSQAMGAAISGLIRRPQQRQRMGRAARRRVEEHFSAEATARGVGRVLDTVLDERRAVRT